MKKTGKSGGLRLLGLAALAAMFVGLGARSASASEFEVIADSFTVANQVNLSSVSYFNTKGTLPANPAAATFGMTTPGGLYFDGTYYKVWDNNASVWVKLATGTVVSNSVTGTGTADKVSRWTASGVLGNSTIEDNGTNVGIGAAPTAALLNVGGTGDATFTNTGNASLNPTGYVDILGLTVGKAAGITTLYSGAGTATPIARIK
ncbi:MAG: hypothetical protein HY403_04495 [Elusimicrobia bacterium]|nr:hypothetical protein [Elusimicrobiota bacterium]